MKLVTLAAGWIAGILLGLELDVYLPAVVLFAIGAVSLALLLWSKGVSLWAPLLAVVLLLGLLRVEVSEGPDSLLAAVGPGPVTILGTVVDDPELSGPGVEFTVSVHSVEGVEGLQKGRGKIRVFARPPRELVQARDEPYFRYGDVLELTGRLEEPPNLGDFDYGAYLANQGIRAVMPFPQVRPLDEGGGNPARGAIYGLRRQVSRGIDRALPEPQASLAQALLLGLRGPLADSVTDDFRSTGTSHLLAISGLHVGTLLAMSLGLGVWILGRRRQLYLLVPLGAVWLYALLSGLSPSVERAAIMASVYLLAMALSRPRSILPALALAAGVMVGLEPQILKQVSFQLSFTAVAGISLVTTSDSPFLGRLFAPPMGGGGWRSALVRWLTLAVVVSVAATVATLPLIAFNFHRIPTLGVPTTILALPALPFLLVTSALVAVAGMAHPVAGQVAGWVAWVPLEYFIRLVGLVAKVPGGTFSVPGFSGLLVWAYYGVLALLLLLPAGRGIPWSRLRRPGPFGQARVVQRHGPAARLSFPVAAYLVAAAGLAALAAMLWFQVATGPDGRLHVHFLDVGQGDSVLITTAEGRQVLVDGGPGPRHAVRAVGNRLKFWDRDLDIVVLTHPDEDHFRGLMDVLDRYRVDTVLESGGDSDNPLYLVWDRSLNGDKTRRIRAFQGQTIVLDEATRLEVLNPHPGT